MKQSPPLVLALVLAAAAGCAKDTPPPGPAEPSPVAPAGAPAPHHGAGPAHTHESPHGGVVASVATGHIELVATPDGALTAYLLDANLAPLPAKAVALTARVGVAAVPLESAGAAESKYQAAVGQIQGEHPAAVVSGTIDGQAVSGRFGLHFEEAGHTHGPAAAPGATAPGHAEDRHDHAAHAGQAGSTMSFATDPPEVRAGQSVTLRFTPKDEGGKVVALEIVHEKVLHLVMVSKGLAWFAHEHPEAQPDGSLTLAFTFPAGGEYWVYTDFTPKGAANLVERKLLNVAGPPMQEPPLAPTPATVTSGDYRVMVHGPDVIRAGGRTTLSFHVMRNGQNVTDLQPYLGAMGHLVGIAAEGGAFVHAHPKGHGGDGHAHHEHGGHGGSTGPMVSFDAHFEQPGLYKIWPQFMHQGTIVIAPMVVDVKTAE